MICLFYCHGIYTLNVQSLGPGVPLLKVPVTSLARNQTLLKSKCAVPENIHTPPLRRETEIRRGGGFQNEAISEGVGVASRGLSSGDSE